MSEDKPVEPDHDQPGAPPPDPVPATPSATPKPAVPPPPVAGPPPLEHTKVSEAPQPPHPEPDALADNDPGAVPPPASSEKTQVMLCHLLALAGLIPPFVLLNVIAPLVLWIVKKGEVPRVDVEGRKSINFQATVTVLILVVYIGMKITSGVPVLGVLAGIVGTLLLVVLALGNIALVVMAAMQVNMGKPAKYPFAYDFVNLFAPKREASDED
ncbi:hypothetical protein BH23VER1_BH23VER1_15130 [soil metagenome]